MNKRRAEAVSALLRKSHEGSRGSAQKNFTQPIHECHSLVTRLRERHRSVLHLAGE